MLLATAAWSLFQSFLTGIATVLSVFLYRPMKCLGFWWHPLLECSRSWINWVSFSQDPDVGEEGQAFYSRAPSDGPNLDGRALRHKLSHTLSDLNRHAHIHTHPLMHEYPHSVDLSLWRCCSGLICHANCCLGVPLQGESPALEELSFASWSLQESTSFPLPREKLWNSQHVFLHSLLETTALHTVLLHPIWMEIERENQGHKCSFPCVHWKERSYMLRSFLNSQISLL